MTSPTLMYSTPTAHQFNKKAHQKTGNRGASYTTVVIFMHSFIFISKDIHGKISDTLTQLHVQGCGFKVETIVIIIIIIIIIFFFWRTKVLVYITVSTTSFICHAM